MDENFNKKSELDIKPNIVHIWTNNQSVKIEIHSQCSDDDIQNLLKSVCGAGQNDHIKMTNYQNVVLPLNSANLLSNNSSQPHYLEIISSSPQLYTTILSQGGRQSLRKIDRRIQNIEWKVQYLCNKIQESSSNCVDIFEDCIKVLNSQVHGLHLSRNMKRRFENTVRPRNISQIATYCLSCPYFSNIHHLQQYMHLNGMIGNAEASQYNWHRIAKTHDQIHTVWIQYQSIQINEVGRSIRDSMKLPTFNMWGYTDAELLQLVRTMFIDLRLTDKFSIPLSTLDRWIFAVYQNYNLVPFHNFTHAFSVVQMVYAVIHITKLYEIYDDLEILTLLFSAISHDLDHPGLNNTFQINARTYLAQRYNDQSPLENHHCAIAFQLLDDDDKNILKQLTETQFKKLREISIKCILATDMVRHGEIISEFRNILHSIDIVNEPAHRTMVMVVIMKACDISNEARPPHISEIWLECLLEEFFQQSDLEKRKGLPYASFMDRDKVTKSNSQCGFIKYVILPLLDLLVQQFPSLEEHLVSPVTAQLDFYNKQQSKSTNLDDKTPLAMSVASKYPMRKTSTGSIPTRKSSVGCVSRRLSLSVNDSYQAPINFPMRKTSTGSTPSRKSSTGSLVLALS